MPCKHFQRGHCKHGRLCTYRHEETSRVPAESGSAGSLPYKVRLCTFFADGRCTKNNCSFAHGREELYATQAATKTSQLCREFSTPAGCKYGEKCRFSHGHEESLRDLSTEAVGSEATAPAAAEAELDAAEHPEAVQDPSATLEAKVEVLELEKGNVKLRFTSGKVKWVNLASFANWPIHPRVGDGVRFSPVQG